MSIIKMNPDFFPLFWLSCYIDHTRNLIDEMEAGQQYMIDTYGKEGKAYPIPGTKKR